MPSPLSRPLFVTFEGGEGVGKTTQIRLLDRWLREQGYELILTREPGGTSLGQDLRRSLLHGSGLAVRAELLLFAADRAQHMAEIVEPALAAGEHVLCDRHVDSMVAYQAFGRQLNLDLILELNRIAVGVRRPDLTFLLDLDPVIGHERAITAGKRADRIEREVLAFHQRVREGFRWLAHEEPGRIHVVDASRSAGQIHVELVDRLLERSGNG